MPKYLRKQPKYLRKQKPFIVEAIQFTLDNRHEALDFIECEKSAEFDLCMKPIIKIKSPEGFQIVNLGNWLIKESKDEYYIFRNDFEEFYELMKE